MLKKKIWLPILIVLLIAIGIGVWHGQRVANQAPIKVYKPVEVEKTEVPPKVDETVQGGHFHEDGTFHAEPHELTPGSQGTAELEEVSVTPFETPTVSPGQPTPSSETVASVALDPETQARVDALLEEAETLSAEASIWSNKLYAESQELQKEIKANKTEIAKSREMRRDPNVDKETYNAFDAALDAKLRATGAEANRINDLYIQNRKRRDEYIRLISEARRLQGLE
ncbi:MAG: hypothetical protein OXN25_03820 [Candidatus Poribacteria bacterium]|nr:hypothetical protein [Candidatus Poribacteria bacterium]